jgi:4-hydroxybenzoate polyprenyltransferase
MLKVFQSPADPPLRPVARGVESLRAYWTALRPHQWIKNVLIFVPLAAAHGLYDRQRLLACLAAFAAFCMGASSGYLFNDLLDLPEDRRGAQTVSRPLASGAITAAGAVALQLALLAAALVIAFRLDAGLLWILAAYYFMMSAYTLALKRVVILDVLILAAGYSLRIAAGAAISHVVPSTWLIAFCGALFMSLALLKRYVELMTMKAAAGEAARMRGYLASDAPIVAAQGIACGYMAVLILALYINTDMVHRLYAHHGLFWLLCVLLLYWTNYMWLMARRGRIAHDPVLFAIKDLTSVILFCAMLVTALGAV